NPLDLGQFSLRRREEVPGGRKPSRDLRPSVEPHTLEFPCDAMHESRRREPGAGPPWRYLAELMQAAMFMPVFLGPPVQGRYPLSALHGSAGLPYLHPAHHG